MLNVQCKKKEIEEANIRKKKDISDEIRKMKSQFDRTEKQFSETDRRKTSENDRLKGSGTGTYRKNVHERERSYYREERYRERSVNREERSREREIRGENQRYYRDSRNQALIDGRKWNDYSQKHNQPRAENRDYRGSERDSHSYDRKRSDNRRRRDSRSNENFRESSRLPTRVEESFSSMINVVKEISANRRDDKKLDPPPTWDENMSPEAWARYVRIWSKAEVKPYRKAQALIEELKKNDKRKGLKEMIVNEIIENQDFDLESPEVIENIISKVKDFLQDSKWSRTILLADKFCKFEQMGSEDNRDFVVRFGNLETKLKNEKVGVNSTFLAAVLLNKSTMNQPAKNNILANFDLENENPDELLKKIKKKIRDLDATKAASKNTEVKETLYGNQNRRNFRDRSRSRTQDRRNFRDRSKSKGRDFGNQQFNSKESNKNWHRSKSRSKSHGGGHAAYSDPKRTYKCDKFQINVERSIFENKVENQAVLDSGCPEMVGGMAWLRTYEHSLGQELERVDKVNYFKFGDTVFKTEMYVKMPLQLGSLKDSVEVGIVKANVPLLISKMKLKEWGGVVDFSENTLFLKATNETIKLQESESGHLTVNVGKTVENNREEIIQEIFMIKKKKEYSMQKLKKLHRVFGHPCQDKMDLLMKDAGEGDSKIMRMMRRIQETCRVCRKFKRKASKPQVGLPKSREINETVSVDLKPVSSLTGDKRDARQVVYMMDEFSRFTAAGISKNKESEEVIKIILNKWCLGIMGYPSRSFFADNGSEFKKSTLEDLSRRLGIKVQLSPSYSPWSNGGNERRHGAVNLTLKKLMEDDSSISLEDALQHALWARNMEIGRNGQSPYQVVLGKSPSLPGVTDGNVVTDSLICESDALRMHFNRQEKVRVLYRQADCSRRLKEAEKVRLQPYHDQKYERGEEIIFLDKNDQWSGPAVVQGTESKTIFATHNGTIKKIASCRARPFCEDSTEDPDELLVETGDELDSDSDELGEVSSTREENTDLDEDQDLTIACEEESEEIVESTESKKSQVERRPKLGKVVKFRRFNDPNFHQGKVTSVGKKTSKDKDKCWIELNDKIEILDFLLDIEEWDYIKKVNFSEGKDKEDLNRVTEPDKLVRKREVAADAEGVFFLSRQEPMDVLAVMVPPSEYHHPEIQAAMKDELGKFSLFDAYEIIDDEGQDTIDGRWVINKKEAHDGLKTAFKARWCLRGFKEETKPRSDSPTVDRLSTKMFYAVAANKQWKVESIDVTAAFLQGKLLDRAVFVVPPKEAEVPAGKIWQMKKAAYGLYDASRRFYCEVVEFLISLGCKTLVGDESFLYYHVDGRLEGCLTVHVDDFQLAGTDRFTKNVSDVIVKKFKISKREQENFKFTGVDVSRLENGDIIIGQEAYKDALTQVSIADENENVDKLLTKDEFKSFRGASGKLQWLAEMTRPDLTYDCLEMSSHGKDATKKELKAINKVMKKAKEHESLIRYSKVGEFEDLKILAVTDGAYLKLEQKTKSIMGRFLFLSNKEETKVVPLMWKSKSIPTVCKSAKDAETRAADKTIEDAIYVARCIREIYTGERGEAQIQVDVVTDSQPLIDSVNSSKQVENKLLRPIIKFMKQMLDAKMISSMRWCDTKVCVADMLTKSGSPLTKPVMNILRSNKMIDLSKSDKRRM